MRFEESLTTNNVIGRIELNQERKALGKAAVSWSIYEREAVWKKINWACPLWKTKRGIYITSPYLKLHHFHEKFFSADHCHKKVENVICSPKVTLYSLTSVCIFSILFPRHFLMFLQGEFVQQSKASLVGDHLLYSHDLSVWSSGDVVGRN